MAKQITTANFQQEVLESSVPVLVDFWATWCGPCRMLGSVIEELAEEADGYVVGKVNVDEEPALAAQFGVRTIPTVILFQNGKAVKQSVGVQPKAFFQQMLSAQ